MKRPLSAIQTLTGSTRSEAIVLLVLLGGLLAGYAISVWDRVHQARWEDSVVARDIAAMLDSTELRSASADSLLSAFPNGPSRATSSAAAHKTAPHPLNLNSAPASELASLPGIGVKTAEKIIERRAMRPFRTPEDIMDVRGIGQKKFERMRPFLRVQ
ncbi:hypothetical protein BH10BAC6_BH10BAC6_06000 [soil metagenome]